MKAKDSNSKKTTKKSSDKKQVKPIKSKDLDQAPEPTETKKNKSSDSQALVLVGIGASAGGLEALRQFVTDLPLRANMAYVIAQHMSPHHRSMMVDLLSRETKLTVYEIKTGTTPKPDSIYVAPPNSDVFVKNGKIYLRKPLGEGAKPSVDYLFASMAEDLGERAIGVVMSGTGTDGSHGIVSINAAGGISIAQEPKTAKYDSMPQAAIKSGADLVLAPDEIAKQLSNIIARPRIVVPDSRDAEKPENALETLVKLIFRHTKLDFSNYKEATLTRQVERRMAVLQINELTDYVRLAEKTDSELKTLSTNFLVCVTSFFRDPEAFDAFRDEIKDILKKKKQGENIRIWVPGCATGEEAYTIAIILAEELGQTIDHYKVQVFATDANPEATLIARKGLYLETSIEGISPELLKKYFTLKDRFFQVDRKIRDLVVFANQDIVQDPPFMRVDAISCRNLLIYFKTELQDKVLRIFHYALNPDGVLFLGKSESLGHNKNLFIELNRKVKIYRKCNVPSVLPESGFAGKPLISMKQQTAPPKIQKSEDTFAEVGHSILFEAYIPPSVLVTVSGEILEFYGDLTPFTHLKPGKADFSLYSIVHTSLRTELRAIIQKVTRSGEVTFTQPVAIKIDGIESLYRTVVRPIEMKEHKDTVLVSFELMQPQLNNIPDKDSLSEVAEARIAQLEHELTVTRESLQTVIEELETSNEELQSMNEEAQAANEELQASNEELETSNEELQATNEELTTVNDELSTKTIQLTEALDDMEIIQNSTDRAIIVVDKELSIRRYNKKSLAFFKIDTAINMQNLASVPVFFEMENLVDKVRQVNWEGKRFMVEFTMDSRQFELDIFPYKTETIHINGGAIINISDITERSDAIRIIRENEIRFRSMIENAGDAIYIHDHLGNIYEVNQVACQQTAYSHRELLAQNVKQLDVGVDFKALKKMWSEGLSDPKKYPLTLETAHRRKDGSVFPIEVRISLMPYQGENRFLAMVRDISERKEAEALLAEKIRELDFQKSALDEHSIVYTINHDGIISYVNEKLCQISGYSRKELVKQHHSMLYDESYDDKMLAKVCQFISKGKVWKGELKSLKKNGHSFWIASTFVPFLNERNMPFQYIAIHTDITDRVIAQSEAEKANKAKSEFLSSMSHELRTPLNSILGLSDLLMTDEDRPLHEDQLNDISLIKMSGSHLLNLIDEILDLARIETRQMTISSQGIKPWDTIKTTFGMLEDMAKKHEVHLNTSESINCVSCPMPCSIFVDSNRFRQILLNLLSNAVKYNKPGGEVKLICRRQDEGFMRFEVIDSGKGIPEDRYDEIFQPFNRLGAEEKGIDGTGIGLTITKELVELLGGTIGFKSQMDKGSVFWIHLPLENGQNEKTIQSSPENVSSKKTGHSGQFSDNKVLYIEDNVFNTELMYKIFSRLDGISLETATNAEQGIELAKKNLPELILMDINLPGMNGKEAFKILQKDDKLKNIPVIAVSANAMQEDISNVLDMGFCEYITKPFEIGELVDLISEKLLRKK